MGGWVQVSLEIIFLENRPKIVLYTTTDILCLYTFSKVVSHYDLSVQSMSVMNFQQKSLARG